MNEYNRFPTDMFGELSRLQRHIDEVFRGAGPARDIRATTRTFPAINVGATADAIEIIALAPGIDPKKIDISIERGILTIAGERPQAGQDDRNSVYAQERFSGAFRRVISLPDDIDPDRVEARYTDGCARHHQETSIVQAARHHHSMRRPKMNTSLSTQAGRSDTALKPASADYALLPAVDIVEDQNGIILTADVPGVSKDKLNVRVEGGHLLIDAEISMPVPDDLNVLHAEVRGGNYHRSFALSSELDTAAVEASLKDGVLAIRVPRTDRAKPRRIEIKS